MATNYPDPRRARVLLGDSLEVIPHLVLHERLVSDVFTGLPDANEMDISVEEWRPWFAEAMRTCLTVLHPTDGVGVFYQTDRRYDGGTESKAHTVIEIANQMGFRVLWHKIAVKGLGTNLFRPNYSHVIAVGGSHARSGKAFPDVFEQGKKVYPNAIDERGLDLVTEFFARRGTSHLLDPFCGWGTIAARASLAGISTTSIDIDPDQVERTKNRLGITFTGDEFDLQS